MHHHYNDNNDSEKKKKRSQKTTKKKKFCKGWKAVNKKHDIVEKNTQQMIVCRKQCHAMLGQHLIILNENNVAAVVPAELTPENQRRHNQLQAQSMVAMFCCVRNIWCTAY